MEQLVSFRGVKLPIIYYIWDKEDLRRLPIGIPYIFGPKNLKEDVVKYLEFNILLEGAEKTGLPFNFKDILKEQGYTNPQKISRVTKTLLDFVSDDMELGDLNLPGEESPLSNVITEASSYVDLEVLKDLKLIPVFLESIEEAIKVNIESFGSFNPYMYNKKLDGVYGGMSLASPMKNLIIIDISGSIPSNVSATMLLLASHLSESFYADIMITGSKSTLYLHEEVHKLNVRTIYSQNGTDNDRVYFQKLISEEREYATAIVFGDNDSPNYKWSNNYNKDLESITNEEGKKFNRWTIHHLISLHTSSEILLAGYARWFSPEKITKITGWVKSIKR